MSRVCTRGRACGRAGRGGLAAVRVGVRPVRAGAPCCDSLFRLARSGGLRASGGMADAHGSGPCVRKDVEVQLLSRALLSARPGQGEYQLTRDVAGSRAGSHALTKAHPGSFLPYVWGACLRFLHGNGDDREFLSCRGTQPLSCFDTRPGRPGCPGCLGCLGCPAISVLGETEGARTPLRIKVCGAAPAGAHIALGASAVGEATNS